MHDVVVFVSYFTTEEEEVAAQVIFIDIVCGVSCGWVKVVLDTTFTILECCFW